MTAATFRATIERAPSPLPARRPVSRRETLRLRRSRAHRVATTLSKNALWVAPALALAWPRADLLLLAFILVVLAGAASLAAVVDEVSSQRRDGEGHAAHRQLAALLFATFVVGALDVGHLDWGAVLHPHVRLAGTLALGLGYLLRTVVMGTNRFFSDVIVVQWERHHVVCDVGPYELVRHPGDLSAIIIVLMIPVGFGSLLALIPAALGAVVIARRTALEDRYLHAHLLGYRDYARRVRWRLLPGVY